MTDSIAENSKRHWNREQVVQGCTAFQAGRAEGRSQVELAEELGVPRATLRDWDARQKRLSGQASGATAFFESEEGLEWLHRICLAAHLVLVFEPQTGIRAVCMFLELSGLSMFVGSSYGVQQKIAAQIETETIAYEAAQEKRLVPQMPKREVSLAEDETFHPEICLVCIEPVSGFILLEKYAQQRDAETWNQALKERLQSFPVEVIQCVSDQAQGILSHTRKGLGAHHSPDLFHIQQDNVHALYPVLRTRLTQEQKIRDGLAAEVAHWENRQAEYQREPRRQGRAPDFDKRISQATLFYREACEQIEAVEYAQQEVEQAIAGIREDYHPYDLNTGQARLPEQASVQLEGHFETLARVATELDLGDKGQAKLRKARRLLPNMLATLTFFFMTVKAKVEALCLPEELEQLLHQQLIPAFYLERVAAQAQTADQHHKLQAAARGCLNELENPEHPWHSLDEQTRQSMEQTARECANLFQRSSSCVEGHNSELALWHHHLHRIRPQRLHAITIVRNYLGTPGEKTHAERFFGAKPDDLFEWLVKQVRLPPRPAKKRETIKQGIWPEVVGHA